MIKDNLRIVAENIRAAASRSGRDPEGVTLIGVTKFADVPAIDEALASGLKDIAENKVQLAKEKFSRLAAGEKAAKHMIGHLQTNKVRDALEIFDLIHSVDSLKLARELQKRAANAGTVADILVQLDIAKEETKFGLPLEQLDAVMGFLSGCVNIRTLGLMTMAPFTSDYDQVRSVFRKCRELFEGIRTKYEGSPNITMKHLSMGMSQDYEIAVEEGATMVRVGTAIFH